MGEHTKGPWVLGQGVDDYGRRYIEIKGDKNNEALGECGVCEEDARRIVNCVNACEGIHNDYLEAAIQDGGIAKLLSQRDELMAGVQICLDAEYARRKKLLPGAPATTYTQARIDRLEATLARAKGEE